MITTMSPIEQRERYIEDLQRRNAELETQLQGASVRLEVAAQTCISLRAQIEELKGKLEQVESDAERKVAENSLPAS